MDQRVILLVEDNTDDETLTLRALKGHNILNPVVVARDGSEALDYLFGRGAHAGRNPRDLPAVMLLDLRLPKVDGLEVLKQLRAGDATRPLPVVILTSSHEDQDLVKGYELGCNSYIRKPVDFEQFRSTVQQLGLYWLVVNQPPPISAAGTKEGKRATSLAGGAKDQTDQEPADSSPDEGTPYSPQAEAKAKPISLLGSAEASRKNGENEAKRTQPKPIAARISPAESGSIKYGQRPKPNRSRPKPGSEAKEAVERSRELEVES